MAETKLVVDNREQLWTLLVEAAQIEHMVMCQYLYACSSLKTEPDEGLTTEQADETKGGRIQRGGDGDDVLIGGFGNDWLSGGTGRD